MEMASIGVILTCAVLAISPAAAPAGGISDENITQFVTTKLLSDESVAAHLIDVYTSDGIVTLTGTAESLLEKEKAGEIAEAVRGVRSVVNDITVQTEDRSDLLIYRDIVDALHADPATEAFDVRAAVADGAVDLSGEVDSWAEREICGEVAEGVVGVKSVSNDIHVKERSGRSDSEIRADILQRLKADVWVDEDRIDVGVKAGRVTLSGSVGSPAEESRAFLDAFVVGVTGVDDSSVLVDLHYYDPGERSVEIPPAVTDEDIESAIRDAYLYDPRVLSTNPDVQVNDGVVKLDGVVDNLAAKNAAGRDAANTVGVWKVENFLRVRPKQMPTDAAVKSSVKAALRRDPYTYDDDIGVTVRNGLVELEGTVDTGYERAEATRVASRVRGAIEVLNGIDVRFKNALLPRPSVMDLKNRIETALWWNPYVSGSAITVSVAKGVATLSGTVDTWNQRLVAERAALEAGAGEVMNNIKVKLYGPEYYENRSMAARQDRAERSR
jgi:osmotically-inducible protein OsmY